MLQMLNIKFEVSVVICFWFILITDTQTHTGINNLRRDFWKCVNPSKSSFRKFDPKIIPSLPYKRKWKLWSLYHVFSRNLHIISLEMMKILINVKTYFDLILNLLQNFMYLKTNLNLMQKLYVLKYTPNQNYFDLKEKKKIYY